MNMQKRTPLHDRLQCIRQIIATNVVTKQEELIEAMSAQGFACTQSMLSRDLRQLRISKVRRKDGTSAYALPQEGQFVEVPTRQERDESRWSVQFSGHLMVLHTPPGHASMVAYDIDSAAEPAFLGTVAGDDTVLVVMAEDVTREEANTLIKHIVKNLR